MLVSDLDADSFVAFVSRSPQDSGHLRVSGFSSANTGQSKLPLLLGNNDISLVRSMEEAKKSLDKR